MALHFGPECHPCTENLNNNNDRVGRETLQLFKSGLGLVPFSTELNVLARDLDRVTSRAALAEVEAEFISFNGPPANVRVPVGRGDPPARFYGDEAAALGEDEPPMHRVRELLA